MADEPWFDPEEDARNFDRREAEERAASAAREQVDSAEMKEAVRRLRAATRAARSASGGGRAATTPGEPERAEQGRGSWDSDLTGPIGGQQEAAKKLADAAEKLTGAAGKLDRSASGGGRAGNHQGGNDPLGQLVDEQIGRLMDDLLRQAGNKIGSAIEGRVGGGVGRAVGQVVGEGGSGGGLLSRLGIGSAEAGAARAAAGSGAASGGGAASAGAAGGAASVAGPVAIALLVDQLAEKAIKDQGEKLRGAIGSMTTAYKSAISGDAEGLARGGSEKVAGTLEGFGISGKIMAEQVRTATEVTFAFKDLYDATIDAAKAQEQHNYRLAEASAAMANVEAQADVRTTFRNQEIGDRTAPSSGDLTDSMQDLADGTKEIRVLVDRAVNTGLARLVDLFGAVIAPIEQTAKGVNAIVSHPLFKRFLPKEEKDGGPPLRFDQIMEETRRAEAESRRLTDEWHRHANDFGWQRRPGE